MSSSLNNTFRCLHISSCCKQSTARKDRVVTVILFHCQPHQTRGDTQQQKYHNSNSIASSSTPFMNLLTKQLHTLRLNANVNPCHMNNGTHHKQRHAPSSTSLLAYRTFATSTTGTSDNDNNTTTSSSSSSSSRSSRQQRPTPAVPPSSANVESDSTYRTHYGTFRRSTAQTQTQRQGQTGQMRVSRQVDEKGTGRYKKDEPMPSSSDGVDLNTLFDSTRKEFEEYRRRIDRDIDPSTGQRPASIRSYIRTLEEENRTPVEGYSTDDYHDIDETDMRIADISPKQKLLGKTLLNRRLIRRLEREEVLQDRLSMLDKYGEDALLKPGDIWTSIPRINADGRAMGFGRRKSSYAHVFVKPNADGTGDIFINKRRYSDYFNRLTHRDLICSALHVTSTFGKWDVECRVWGGGHSGQADAVKLALTRAINNYEPNYRQLLKSEFLFYRDPREVERKKFGKYKARKSFTYVRR